jgi:pyruvate dehydrogenase E2 component (dihydrolipoamide acetyltransferase)
MIEILMPQGGQDIEKGRVVRWLKNVGDQVQKGDVLCEVETEKAMFEIESPGSGQLRSILVADGNEAPILSVIGLVGDPSEAVQAAAAAAPPAAPAEEHADQPVVETPALGERGGVKISPKARRIAEENNVSYTQIRGSGPGGRIIEKDVMDFIAAGKSAAGVPSAAQGGGRLLELDRRRKATGLRMASSKQTIPHFYVTRAIDMTRALAFRESLNADLRRAGAVEASVNDLILRACALALRAYPQLNASLKDEDHIMRWDDVNIGVAVSVDENLMAPVIENADRLPLAELAVRARAAVQAAREGKLLSLAPGRFTVSNMGMYGVDEFTAIINAPEAAILAVASIQKRVIVENGLDLRIRDMLNVTLSIDHRICDGVMACQFVNKVKELLESPEQLQ